MSQDDPTRGIGFIASADASARELATTALEREGFSVFEIEDTALIVDFLASARPDLLVLDAASPGIDIRDICTTLRGMEGGSRVRVLVLTEEGDSETVEHALEAGVSDLPASISRRARSPPVCWAIASGTCSARERSSTISNGAKRPSNQPSGSCISAIGRGTFPATR